MPRRTPVRALRTPLDLDQLKRQAKDLFKAYQAGDADAVAEVNAHFTGANTDTFQLHDAQLVLARAYGFASWPKLRAHVDGVNVRRLADAVRAGDLATVRSIVEVRPELVTLDMAENDEHQALHHAVLSRQPEIARLLMRHGADPHKGIWPHRDATSPLTLAVERGYTEIADIIREEEKRQRPLGVDPGSPVEAQVEAAIGRDDEDGIIAILDAHPELAAASDSRGTTALHWATSRLWPKLTAWLIDRGANLGARTNKGNTPLDVLGRRAEPKRAGEPGAVARFAEMLVARGAERSSRWAIAVGAGDWLRARHAQGALANQSGLVSHAILAGRLDMLKLLLELGLDPDEHERVAGLEETVPSWGGPLRACAEAGNVEMADVLLAHGANPNTNVYAASAALSIAYSRHDTAMIALLEKHGGRLSPLFVGDLGLVAQAERMLADAAAGRAVDGTSPGASVAQDLLWGAIGRPSPEIVHMALEQIDWPRDDQRWHGILENGLYLGPSSDRPRHLEAFRLTLARCSPNVTSKRSATLLHDIAASRGGLTAGDRVAYATLLLDAGARLDIRDHLLASTALGWACRWGRMELVRLLLERGADPIEADAEPWTTPRAWAEKRGHTDMLDVLRR